MDFEEIGEVIDGERIYQKLRWGHFNENGTITETEHTVGNYICFMQNYLRKAQEALSGNSSDDKALDELRKVVALGVACFEQHDMVERDLSKPIVNGHDGKTTQAYML